MTTSIVDTLVTRLAYRQDPNSLRQAEAGLVRLKHRLNTMSAHFLRVGGALTAAGVVTVGAFAKYERKMATIEGLVGVSRDQLSAWQGDLSRIERLTGKLPTELADALFFLTSAQIPVTETMDTLRITAKASAAGLGEHATIVDLVTSVMSAYEKQGIKAARATDVLVQSIRLGKLDPAQLAGGMSQVVSVAAELGVEYEQVAGLFAGMSKSQSNVMQNATALNAIMSSFLKPSEEAKKILEEELQMSPESIRAYIKETGDLLGVLRQIKTVAGDDLGLIGKIFPLEAIKGVANITGGQMQNIIDTVESMYEAAGTTDEAFDAVAKTTSHKWTVALSVVHGALIRIGRRLKPVTDQMLDFAAKLVSKYKELSDSTKDFVARVLTMGRH